MSKPRLRGSGYANLMSSIAVVLALGGTATAAALITSADVKDGSLKSVDVANGNLTGKDVKDNSLRSRDVAGLKAGDFVAGVQAPTNAWIVRSPSLNAQTCGPGGCTAGATLAELDLPAGSYVLSARATVAPFSPAANSQRSGECHLNVGDTIVDRDLTVIITPSSGGTVQDETMTMSTAVELTEPGTASLSCSVGSEAYTASTVNIIATEVSNLTVLPLNNNT